jgi:hypothetical protein
LLSPFHQATAAQQHQQLHKQHLARGEHASPVRPDSAPSEQNLAHLQRGLIHPPVRRIVLPSPAAVADEALRETGTHPANDRAHWSGTGCRYVHTDAVVVAHKADRTAADGVGLAVKDMDTRAVLNNHNFMKIMMMLRKAACGSRAQSPQANPKEKSTLCSTVITPPPMRNVLKIVIKAFILTLNFRQQTPQNLPFFKKQRERSGNAVKRHIA